jgi:hypothetical protein
VSAFLAALVVVLFHLPGTQIGEASGIAHGSRSSDVYYVHNDSSDRARFFAIDRRTGATRATYRVPGAANVDWEDIAVAPDSEGTSSVWIADIGDNRRVRRQVALYRVDEPKVPRGRTTTERSTAQADVWRLRYPDGAHDAEALLVEPTTHRAYIVTKTFSGTSTVYAVPASPQDGRLQTLRRVASIRIPIIVGGPRDLAITGGAIAPDGERLLVRTYTAAYLWPLQRGDVVGALRAQAKPIDLPSQRQGEGITVDGARIVIVSEGAGTPVYAVTLPPARPATTPTPRATLAADRNDSDTDYTIAYLVIGAVAFAVLLGIAARTFVRRTSGQRR